MSQFGLAQVAGLSSRHLSFVENGRSVPGEHLVKSIVDTFSLPPRSRSRLFDLAGYRRVTNIEDTVSIDADFKHLLHTLLSTRAHQLLLVKDPNWRLIGVSEAGRRLLDFLLPREIQDSDWNILNLVLSPDYLRPSMESWEDIASDLLLRVKHEFHRVELVPLRIVSKRLWIASVLPNSGVL